MHEEYYLLKLYPLQDRILNILMDKRYNRFYLTGGTALSRFYFQHRYSEDLDFFSNQSGFFLDDIKALEETLKDKSIKYTITSSSQSFRRFVVEEDCQLKIEFVNDVGFRYGNNVKFEIFNRVDNLRNILSNKLTALERNEPKDVADILFICRNFSFKWENIFEDALRKVSFIDPIIVSKQLSEYRVEFLSKLKWKIVLDLEKAEKDIRIISRDILVKNINSIHSN